MYVLILILVMILSVFILYSIKFKGRIYVGTISEKMIDSIEKARSEGYKIYYSDYFLIFFKNYFYSLKYSEKKSLREFLLKAASFKKVIFITNDPKYLKYIWVNSIFSSVFVYDKRVSRKENIKYIEDAKKEIIHRYVPPYLSRDPSDQNKDIPKKERKRIAYLMKLNSFPSKMFLE